MTATISPAAEAAAANSALTELYAAQRDHERVCGWCAGTSGYREACWLGMDAKAWSARASAAWSRLLAAEAALERCCGEPATAVAYDGAEHDDAMIGRYCAAHMPAVVVWAPLNASAGFRCEFGDASA